MSLIFICRQSFHNIVSNLEGHEILWDLGIEHTDPSLNNMMVASKTTEKGETWFGVLNDWDLSTIRLPHDQPDITKNRERTGTIPFMAMDLLCKEYMDGHIAREYRHDLEGFIWVLPWVCLQYEGSQRINLQLGAWETGDYVEVLEKKSAFFYSIYGQTPTDSYAPIWGVVRNILRWLSRWRLDMLDRQNHNPSQHTMSSQYDFSGGVAAGLPLKRRRLNNDMALSEAQPAAAEKAPETPSPSSVL